MVSNISSLVTPICRNVPGYRSCSLWKALLVSGLGFLGCGGFVVDGVAAQPYSELSPPRSVQALKDSSDDYLLVGAADKVSCLLQDVGSKIFWETQLEAPVAGLATHHTPKGGEAYATDVQGGVYAWDGSGQLLTGWPRHLEAVVTASPAWIDWAGGAVAVPDHNGLLHVLDRNGDSLPGWPAKTGARVLSAVSVANMGGTPVALVATEDGKLFAFQESGQPVEGFPVNFGARFVANPAVSDLTGDSMPEICIGSVEGAIWLLDSSGQALPGWPVEVSSPVGTTPVFGDVDGDSQDDVVVATRSGGIHAYRIDGNPLEGWPQKARGMVLSSPTVVDLDGFSGQEVLVASAGGWAHAWNGSGEPLPYWPRFLGLAARVSPTVQDQAPGGVRRIALPSADGLQFVSVTSFDEQETASLNKAAPEETDSTPTVFSLRMNANPLVASQGGHAVHLSIPGKMGSEGVVTAVAVFDLRGRRISKVFSGLLGPGVHVLPWRPENPVSSGVYFVRAVTGGKSITTKVLILQ